MAENSSADKNKTATEIISELAALLENDKKKKRNTKKEAISIYIYMYKVHEEPLAKRSFWRARATLPWSRSSRRALAAASRWRLWRKRQASLARTGSA